MKFIKMQGAGNDYVYVDCFREAVPVDPPALARVVSDRHFGIGADGLILVCPTKVDDVEAEMRMFNADGSYSEMCGNGIRCVAKLLIEEGHVRGPRAVVLSGGQRLELEAVLSGGKVSAVRVDMGAPILRGTDVPTTLPGEPVLNVPLEVAGRTLQVTCISMGNPHCVVFVDEPTDEWVLHVGPQIEQHPAFPKRVNVEFVAVESRGRVRQRTWERGSGETLACGTGASAVCVAGVLSGQTDRELTVQLLGGDLQLEWNEADQHVYMTGPAVEVFRGEWPDRN